MNFLTSNCSLNAVEIFRYIPRCPLTWALMILLTTSSLSVTIPSPLTVNTPPYIGKLLILATRMNYSFTEYPHCTSLYHFDATHDLPFLILCDCVAPRHSISFSSSQCASAIETSLRIAASLSRLGPRDKQQAKQQAAEFETPPSLSSTSFTASPCLLKKTRGATYNRRLELQVVFIATCVFQSWCLRYMTAPDVIDHVVLTLAPGHRCCAQLLVVFQAEVRLDLLLLPISSPANKSRALIYPSHVPNDARTEVPRPSQFGITDFEDLMIPTPDGENLSAFYIRPPKTGMRKGVTVLMFHGNAGNIGHRVPIARMFVHRMGCSVLMLEYRGYGLSTGSPDETGLMIDAQTAFDYLRNRSETRDNDIVVFGQSLGGAVSIQLVAKNQNDSRLVGLVLENTFLSMRKLIPSYVSLPRFPRGKL